MTKLAASGFATAVALVMLAGSAVAGLEQHEAVASKQSPALLEPADTTPIGRCRIRFEGLADDRQPAAMECEHAHWVAQRWGGRVLEKTGAGLVERAVYDGHNDFTGLPAGAAPRAGYCRAWIDGLSLEDQPEDSDCRRAQRTAASEGGRVLYMPL
jgi:hypothetical protein